MSKGAVSIYDQMIGTHNLWLPKYETRTFWLVPGDAILVSLNNKGMIIND
jgi:hypothetical protein